MRTTTVSVSETVNIPSVAVRVRTYVPATVKVAVVTTEAGSAKPTAAGPLEVHVVVNALGAGRPSSVAVPVSDTLATGKRIS